MSLASVSQSANPGEIVALFRLDTTKLGGQVYYFTPGAIGGEPVVFGGQIYTPIDILFSDFEVNAGGSLPTPTMEISNADSLDKDGNVGFVQGMLNAWGDLVGCEIRRVRTFKRFLDGQSEADPAAFMGPDVFRIERKAEESKVSIKWELSAAIDQEGTMIPGRQILRDTCVKRYRRYDPTNPDAAADGFVYATINPCPYVGTSFFTQVGDATSNPALDRCGRKLTDCEKRFGKSNPLPFGGFPGAARVRLS